MSLAIPFSLSDIQGALPFLLTGLKITLEITVVGLIIGFVIGLLMGMATLSKSRWISWPGQAYMEFFRGTPILVQALFIFFGLPDLIGRPIPAFAAGVAAVALNSGGYICEIVRGGVKSIEKEQREAGLAVGLSESQTFRYIIWPQAFRRIVPPLGNQGIISLKDTSVFSVIGVGELVRQGQVYIATTFNAFEIYFVVAIMYLIVTLTFSFFLRWLERNQGMGMD
jgi:glutamine transport system permease protein